MGRDTTAALPERIGREDDRGTNAHAGESYGSQGTKRNFSVGVGSGTSAAGWAALGTALGAPVMNRAARRALAKEKAAKEATEEKQNAEKVASAERAPLQKER